MKYHVVVEQGSIPNRTLDEKECEDVVDLLEFVKTWTLKQGGILTIQKE